MSELPANTDCGNRYDSDSKQAASAAMVEAPVQFFCASLLQIPQKTQFSVLNVLRIELYPR